MSKKRRPHKPGHVHRPPAPAPQAASASTDASLPVETAAELPDASGATGAGSPSAASDPGRDADASPAPSPRFETGPAAPSAAPAAVTPPASTDIRGVLIQVAGTRLLLPNATIAEVLSYADPEPVGGDVPDWLLGRMRWRGWQLPLIAFGRLAGVAEEKAALGSKVVVLKALAGTGRIPYFAMLTQGFPRLVTVSRGGLELEDDDAGAMPRGVQARVRLNENDALLPDLEAIEALVGEALAQAA
jgi:chemosensory pili system protein ChpC